MIEILKKYYVIEIKDYTKYNEGIIFCVDGIYYWFLESKNDEQFINELFLICEDIKKCKIPIHDFVFNKDGKLLSDKYVLFKINTLICEIDYKDVKSFINCKIDKYKEHYISMNSFWEEKIDYLELQLSELSANKLINNSFDYYVGISEILTSFYRKNVFIDDKDIVLVHRCLNSLNTLDFYNPLNICFDYSYKDIASYIRLINDWNLLDEVLSNINDYSDKCYFFIRMCFPFQYFNEISDILLNNKDNSNLVDILNNNGLYEEYLYKIEKMFGIYLFSWIKKE